MDVVILNIAHKPFLVPNDPLYLPLQVGFGDSFCTNRDNTGDNIAEKNKTFCELTGLYWAWKNLKGFDYIGLDHYRRHFASKTFHFHKKDRIISKAELIPNLKRNTIIVPKPRHYFIETNYSQYIHSHHEIDLKKTRDIISSKYPDYLEDYDKYMKQTSGHRFNMMIMPKDIFNQYCTWLFDILFELEKQLDISNYSDYDKRVFGFISERLIDVFVAHNKINFIDWPYVYMENQNWFVKGYKFLARKVKGNHHE